MRKDPKQDGWRATRALGLGGLMALAVLVTPVASPAQECSEGMERIGSIGLTGFSCSNCTFRTGNAQREERWTFRSEPEILGVRPNSPAAGVLRSGDQIVAIDGVLITTAEGGRLMANLPPDRDLEVTYRRDGTERVTRMRSASVCEEAASERLAYTQRPDAVVAPTPPSAGIARGVPAAEPAPATEPALAPPPEPRGVAALAPGIPWQPDAWFGVGLRCTRCSWNVDQNSGASTWDFSEPPSITNVEPGGPADRAGLRRGDVILEVDGLLITSEDGGRRFGAAQPGETLAWTVERAGVRQIIDVTAAPRPAPGVAVTEPTRARGVTAAVPPASPDAPAIAPTGGVAAAGPWSLRYAGTVGDADIEVRAAGPVVVNIVEPGREIEIVTGDSRTTVRIAPDDR